MLRHSPLLEVPIFFTEELAKLRRVDTDASPRTLAEALEAIFRPEDAEEVDELAMMLEELVWPQEESTNDGGYRCRSWSLEVPNGSNFPEGTFENVILRHTFFVWPPFVLLLKGKLRNMTVSCGAQPHTHTHHDSTDGEAYRQRKVGAVKKASGIQDTLTINEALEDNGNAAKKVCENFGCVVREHKNASPNYELRSQASIEAHEEKMQAIQKKLTGFFDKATTAELGKDLLKEAQAFNQKRNQHNKFDL
ncbi:Protein CBG23971 [Caenorhabditis briggsae]|uniref:Protein CBG23971 n=1 Tax=Caenorhabditis briggsae TaxID=6238 RepID=A8WJP5_CAEBR|nr:Protein CBG23971 [Caenorhabditis briggsae]CAP20688.2 Protein CBG23971 [Caenorhabditis briggsae]